MQKGKKKGIKLAYVVSAIVMVIVLAVNIACGVMADFITIWLCSTTALSSAAREKGETLATQIVEEGIVMVKNEDASLPLSEEVTKVNVFGWGASEWVNGGSGSGRVVNNDNGNAMTPETTILDALENANIEYNTAITQMYENFQKNREYWESGTLNSSSQQFYRLYEPSITDEAYYTADMLAEAKEYSETAIVVLGRVAGESNDCPTEQYKRTTKGGTIQTDKTRTYLDISVEEEDLLTYVGANYKNVIVLINATNTMNLNFMDTIPGLDSCLIVGGTGNNAAKGVINVMYGVSPSGKTADTYAYDFKTNASYANSGENGTMRYTNSSGMYPSNKGTVNGDSHYQYGVSYVDYVEGIYVGYKWYETADAEGYWADVDNVYGKGYEGVVQYPFGYGLSYTSFEWDVVNVTPAGGALDVNGQITVTVRVTNTGAVAGKEVVQLYYTAPYTKNGIEKSAITLAAFAKTPVDVEPGETQELTLSFDVRDMASYDSQEIKVAGGGYILEKGEYQIKLMKNAHEAAEVQVGSNVYSYTLSQDYVYATDKTSSNLIQNLFTGENAVDGFSLDGSDTNANIQYLTRADFEATFPEAPAAAREMTQEMKDHHLYDSADAAAWLQAQGNVSMPTQGASGDLKLYDNNQELTELGQELGNPDNYYDDALWDPLLDQITVNEMKNLTAHGYTKEERVNSVGKTFLTNSVDGPAQAGSFNQKNAGTGYPNATVLAQSWNTQLAKSFGASLAVDALGMGYEGLYATGMNMHRTPFGGRNYEYYSEDSCLTGAMAASTINGCLDGGVYLYVKHFAIYEQETCRDSLYTWMTEQALREIYLSPFKTCIEDAQLTGLMSAYGRVGATWAGGSQALLTNLLRDEWGFMGAVITDYADHHEYMNGDQMIRAGGDLWMDGVSEGKYDMETSSAAMVTRLRAATKNILFMILNADYRLVNASDEGITISKASDVFVWWIPALIGFDVVVVGACGAWVTLTILKGKKKALTGEGEVAEETVGDDTPEVTE